MPIDSNSKTNQADAGFIPSRFVQEYSHSDGDALSNFEGMPPKSPSHAQTLLGSSKSQLSSETITYVVVGTSLAILTIGALLVKSWTRGKILKPPAVDKAEKSPEITKSRLSPV